MDVIFYAFLFLLAVHWVADFVCQTHWQAMNKSKNIRALENHVATYMVILAVATFFMFDLASWVYFVLINGVLHFITDYFTSKWTAKLYKKKDWHNFFVVVGFDQLIHQMTLAATLRLALL